MIKKWVYYKQEIRKKEINKNGKESNFIKFRQRA